MAAISVRYADRSADLKHIRCEDSGGQGRWSFSSQQATLLSWPHPLNGSRKAQRQALAARRRRVRERVAAIPEGAPPTAGLRAQDRHKAESPGRVLVAVEPRNTSRACPDCGHCGGDNRVTQADFRCLACAFAGHGDQVGALNILRAGLARHTASAA